MIVQIIVCCGLCSPSDQHILGGGGGGGGSVLLCHPLAPEGQICGLNKAKVGLITTNLLPEMYFTVKKLLLP